MNFFNKIDSIMEIFSFMEMIMMISSTTNKKKKKIILLHQILIFDDNGFRNLNQSIFENNKKNL